MSQIDQIPGLGGRRDLIAPVAGADLSRLSEDERALLSCVGGSASIGDVLARCGMDERKAATVLLALRVKGAIAPARVSRGAMPAIQVPTPRPAPAPAAPGSEDAAALAEAVDLEPERKREILELDRSLGQKNHFEVLGIEPSASADEVKRAFHGASLRYHPDRYFGKNLGSFKARLERIFRRLTEANAVLSDPNRREAYLKEHPEIDGTLDFQLGTISGPETDARAAERRARMARHPYLAQARRGNDLVAEARAAMEKGDFSRAHTHLQTVTKMDPRNREAPELLRELRRKQDLQRCQQELELAQRHEAEANYIQAAMAYRNASNADTQNATAAAKAAVMMLRVGEDAKQAKLFAQRAVELEPRNASYRALLGRVLLDAGMKRLAKKEYEKALELDSSHAEAKEQLRKLRWTF